MISPDHRLDLLVPPKTTPTNSALPCMPILSKVMGSGRHWALIQALLCAGRCIALCMLNFGHCINTWWTRTSIRVSTTAIVCQRGVCVSCKTFVPSMPVISWRRCRIRCPYFHCPCRRTRLRLLCSNESWRRTLEGLRQFRHCWKHQIEINSS